MLSVSGFIFQVCWYAEAIAILEALFTASSDAFLVANFAIFLCTDELILSALPIESKIC